ncbi:alpha/beta hydrolase [Dokdonella soli]|uniref:Proline iminopeptidase n=1 Tax=Dokdonella soli TaxID=529810 RepID=A0ABN1IDF5_9GAMM
MNHLFALFAFALFLSISPRAFADECKETSRYADARAIVKDLDHIVAPNGVQESYKTRIGGIDQWLNVRGQDKANPILLFIHGGPASPLMPTLWQFERPIEEYFTVVNWDQRGAGKTYTQQDPNAYSDSIHIDRYVDDAIEVAEYVRKRYGKRKVVLAGHSWGTVIGMHAALKRPDLFYAYVGIGQNVNTLENERVSFNFGLEQAKAHGNTEAIKELTSIAPYPGDQPLTRERIIIARKWPQFYGGMSAFRESSDYFFNAALLSPDYEDRDRCAIDQGNVFSLGRLLPEFLAVDFTKVHSFPIPLVIFMGRHDYTTPSEPTAAWLQQVKAPYKQGVWFENSAHMIPWEEPGKTVISLVQYVRPLVKDEEGAKR